MKIIFTALFILSIIFISSCWYFNIVDFFKIKAVILTFDLKAILELDNILLVTISSVLWIAIYLLAFTLLKVFRSKKVKLDVPQFLPKRKRVLSSTKLGSLHGLEQKEVFDLLKDLGYIELVDKRYVLTELGKLKGGGISKMPETNEEYITWPQTLSLYKPSNLNDFSARYTSRSGHKVRSRGDLIIADFLFLHGILFNYERKLPIAEDVHCDFYLNQHEVYIEYWGMEGDQKYDVRKSLKTDIYKQHNLRLLEINDEDLDDIHNTLPRKLLKYGIKIK